MHRCEVVAGHGAPGEVIDNELTIACGEGAVNPDQACNGKARAPWAPRNFCAASRCPKARSSEAGFGANSPSAELGALTGCSAATSPTGTSTLTSPAFSKVRVSEICSPFLRGALSPISITWSFLGLRLTVSLAIRKLHHMAHAHYPVLFDILMQHGALRRVGRDTGELVGRGRLVADGEIDGTRFRRGRRRGARERTRHHHIAGMRLHHDGYHRRNGEARGESKLEDKTTHRHEVRFDMGMIVKPSQRPRVAAIRSARPRMTQHGCAINRVRAPCPRPSRVSTIHARAPFRHIQAMGNRAAAHSRTTA